jgi:hypothetical protein
MEEVVAQSAASEVISLSSLSVLSHQSRVIQTAPTIFARSG